jgi:hypothetical protein
MKRLFFNKEFILQVALLVVISGLVYLPRIDRLQYYKDDWYYVLDGTYAGPSVFNEMFAIDRPARGPFFQAYFSLFGANPLPYHLGHYFWRVSAALAALWLFRMVWPARTRQAFFAALFFLIYPGYLWWTSGIEYQPMVVSLCLQVLSIALTVKAILSKGPLKKTAFALGSILAGWGYLALVDYAIGMEFFRLAIIFVLVNRKEHISLLRKGFETLKVWFYSSFLIPAGFLFWKIFLFTSERKVTDLGIQLGPFLEAPRQALKLWLVSVVRDGLTVSFLAWIEPFSESFWNLSLNAIIVGMIFAAALVVFIYAAVHSLWKATTESATYEPLIVGLVSCFVGVIPVVIANRYVDFGNFSHYSLPASLASALFLASLVQFLTPGRMQLVFAALVVAAAALTHYTAAINVVNEIDTVNSFWWQTYWRAPGIREGTTLIVDYPGLGLDDQTDNVWGPANLLYYPDERQTDVPILYKLAALPLRGPELEDVLLKGKQRAAYRTHSFRYKLGQILVLSQPMEGDCVRILDGKISILSSNDPPGIAMVTSYSKPDNILLDGPGQPPSPVFGKEPDHGWCYYFEKLELAIQQGDNRTALSLADEALGAGLSPQDPVEWTPFLLTYMNVNDLETVKTIAKDIKKDEALEKQMCDVFLKHYRANSKFTPEMIDTLSVLFCHQWSGWGATPPTRSIFALPYFCLMRQSSASICSTR